MPDPDGATRASPPGLSRVSWLSLTKKSCQAGFVASAPHTSCLSNQACYSDSSTSKGHVNMECRSAHVLKVGTEQGEVCQ